jgi:CheY-like chemotaxis protein
MRPVEPPDTSRGAHLAGPPGPTMLIVEDESSIARALVRLLAHEAYQVELVANGQEALGACQRREYTRILCDLWMPTLDGRSFYQALQRCQPQLCARVVFCTGDTLTPDLQTFLAHTGLPVLTKPFTAACVRSLLTAC